VLSEKGSVKEVCSCGIDLCDDVMYLEVSRKVVCGKEGFSGGDEG